MEFEEGQEVLVKNSWDSKWYERIFLREYNGKYICVDAAYEFEYMSSDDVPVCDWEEIKKKD